MKTSCVVHPPDDRFAMIRQWQVQFCDGNVTAAALLNFFIGWHDFKLRESAKAKQLNDLAARHGDTQTHDEHLWQFHSEQELRDGIMGIASGPTVRAATKLLIQKGVLEMGRNPNPRYAFDRTNFFLLHPAPLNAYVSKELSDAPERNSSRSERTFGPSEDSFGPSEDSFGTIPEITSETPPEMTTERGGVCVVHETKEPAPSSACSGPAPTGAASLMGTKKNGATPWPSVEALVELYNTRAPDECPVVDTISPGRRTLAKHALKAFPELPFWERVFQMLDKSPVLRGLRPSPGHENWTADFDWLLAKKDGVENCLKVYDGRYL